MVRKAHPSKPHPLHPLTLTIKIRNQAIDSKNERQFAVKDHENAKKLPSLIMYHLFSKTYTCT